MWGVKMKTYLILSGFIMMALFGVPFIFAEIQTLGTFKQYECITLRQICSNCSYNYVSVLYPNSSTALSLIIMTKDGNYYSYGMCNKSSILGNYIVQGVGDLDGVNTTWTYDYEITREGKNLGGSEVGIYIVGFIFLSIITFILFIFSIKIPFKNSNRTGTIEFIKQYRVLKIGSILLTYLSVLFLTALAMQITRYLYSESLYNIFRYVYILLISLVFPFVIASIVLMFVIFIHDYLYNKKLKRLFKGGNPFEDGN